MKRPLNYLLIFLVILGLSGISLAAEKVKTTQSKITTMHPTEKYIGINLDNESFAMHTDGDTKITKSGSEIKFTDLDVGDKTEVSYVKRDGFLGLGGTFVAKTIEVLEQDLYYDSDS
jgi:hypothetical protein